MSTVQTARGAVQADALGATLMHEHIFVLDPAVRADYGAGWWDEAARVDDAVAKLNAAHSKGIDTLVDVTVLGIGRDIRLLERIAGRVALNIVVSTGLYMDGELPRLFRNRGPGLAVSCDEPLVEAFVKDVRVGIGATSIKAGMLKGAWETVELSAPAMRVHRALAQTQMATGLPITVHTNSVSQTGREVVRLYRGEGVDLGRLVIAHAGDSTDLAYLRELMDAGAVAGFDRFGLDVFGQTPARVRTLAALCELGYADRIILSQDAAAFTESWPYADGEEALSQRLPDWHYAFLVDDVLDLLRGAGVSSADIDKMLRANPRRLLAAAGD